jgi:predicted Zn-dependent protease
MRSILLLAVVGAVLAAAPGAAFGVGGGQSAQERATEYVRLGAQLKSLFAEKKYEEAAETCRKMADLVPQSPEPHYNLACALVHLGKKDDALAAKADVNAKTNAGESALRIAKARRFQNIVAILEKAGAKD